MIFYTDGDIVIRTMTGAEKLAGEWSPKVGVGVGLHSGYGSAQETAAMTTIWCSTCPKNCGKRRKRE